MRFLIISLLILSSCREKDGVLDSSEPQDSTVLNDTSAEDADEDGAPLQEDCDDTDATVFPGAEEVCDGVDNDCNGEIDEESAAEREEAPPAEAILELDRARLHARDRAAEPVAGDLDDEIRRRRHT